MLIQRMRDGSEGILTKVIIGLIVIVFGLFGFGSITTFLAPTARVAEVNGEDITRQSMEMAVERNRQILIARGVSPGDIDEDELRENVLNGLISREVLSQAAAELDLHYGEAALDAEIIATDSFMRDGAFSAEEFRALVRSAGYTPVSYRDELRTDKLFAQMRSGISQSAFVTGGESRRYGALGSQTRDLAYLQISAESLADQAEVTDDDVLAHYQSDTQEFVTDETVSLEYVELDHEALAASFDVDEGALTRFYEENLTAYVTDERRRVAHILIETSADVAADDAKARAEEIRERISGGEDFATLARELSDDIGSRENGGDLGFNAPGTFLPEFEAVAWELAVDQLSAPVATEFGYHLVKVLEIEPEIVPALAEIRDEIERDYRLDATEEEFVSLSARLAELLFESGDLEAPAAELGLEVHSTGHLSRQAQHELMSDERVSEAAFSPDVLLDGNNSDLLELSDSRHVGIRVVEHKPSVTRPLDEVREDILATLQREQAGELAGQRAQAIVEAIEGGSLAQYVADEYGLTWERRPAVTRTQPGTDPAILREAFLLPRPAQDKESIGHAMLPGGDYVVLRVSGVTNPQEDEVSETDIAGVRSGLAEQLGEADFRAFEDGLVASASLERMN